MDSKFKKWAERYNENPSEQTWNRIHKKLEMRSGISANRKRIQKQHLLTMVIAALILLLLLLLAYFGLTYYSSSK